jgi:hypothetical protein
MNRARFLTALGVAAAGAVGGQIAAAAIRVRVGDTLNSSTGSWLGDPNRFTYAFQRHKIGTPWILVQDGASDHYLLLRTDAGYIFRAQVTAYNNGESKPATSQPTGPVRK